MRVEVSARWKLHSSWWQHHSRSDRFRSWPLKASITGCTDAAWSYPGGGTRRPHVGSLLASGLAPYALRAISLPRSKFCHSYFRAQPPSGISRNSFGATMVRHPMKVTCSADFSNLHGGSRCLLKPQTCWCFSLALPTQVHITLGLQAALGETRLDVVARSELGDFSMNSSSGICRCME